MSDMSKLEIGDTVVIKIMRLGPDHTPYEDKITGTVIQVQAPFSFSVKYDQSQGKYGEYREYPLHHLSNGNIQILKSSRETHCEIFS